MNENRFADAKDFIEKVREAFLTLAEKKEWKVVDATRSKEDIHKDIIRIVENFIGS
jgi:dTMP kinase